MHETILIVEDDHRLAALLRDELTHAGYRPSVASTGKKALQSLQQESYALVILDLNLPDIDGLDIAEQLRDVPGTSILMLTARGDVPSRVEGLYAGASDYVTKPFEVQELLARIHVRLRERGETQEVVRIGQLELDPEAGQCLVEGEPLTLTAREFRLLELLLSNRGRIFSKEDLEDRLYGPDLPSSNTVEVFISNVRRKLAEVGVGELISTVRGMGYVVR